MKTVEPCKPVKMFFWDRPEIAVTKIGVIKDVGHVTYFIVEDDGGMVDFCEPMALCLIEHSITKAQAEALLKIKIIG